MSSPKTYVGITENLTRRLSEHNQGKSFYTKKHKPWFTIFVEACESYKTACRREIFYKSGAGRRFIKNLIDS